MTQSCCVTCAEAKEKYQTELAENQIKPLNSNVLASCGKVRDDCQTLISHYFNMQQSMEREQQNEYEFEQEVLDLANPTAINAFCKKIFHWLVQLDEKEGCRKDEDKRSATFRDKIF